MISYVLSRYGKVLQKNIQQTVLDRDKRLVERRIMISEARRAEQETTAGTIYGRRGHKRVSVSSGGRCFCDG